MIYVPKFAFPWDGEGKDGAVDFHGHGDGEGGEGGPKSGVDGEDWMIFYVFIFQHSSSQGSSYYNGPNPSIYNIYFI